MRVCVCACVRVCVCARAQACDVAEDVAIAYGYNNVPRTVPDTVTVRASACVRRALRPASALPLCVMKDTELEKL